MRLFHSRPPHSTLRSKHARLRCGRPNFSMGLAVCLLFTWWWGTGFAQPQTPTQKANAAPPSFGLQAAVPWGQNTGPATQQVALDRASKGLFGWIDFLMQSNDLHRAESELLRFMIQAPQHPQIPRAKIQQIILYQAAKRHRITERLAYAFLDQYPKGPHLQKAWALLASAQIAQGKIARATQSLTHWARHSAKPIPFLPPTLGAPYPKHTQNQVQAWGSAFPGGGFFYQGETQEGWWSLLLSLGLIGLGIAHHQRKPTHGGASLLVLLGTGIYVNATHGALQKARQKHAHALANARNTWLNQWEGRVKITHKW